MRDHRIVGAGRNFWRSSSPTPLLSSFSTGSCTGKYPGGFWVSPEEETPQPLWTAFQMEKKGSHYEVCDIITKLDYTFGKKELVSKCFLALKKWQRNPYFYFQIITAHITYQGLKKPVVYALNRYMCF